MRALPATLLLLCACGGLDNGPLRVGEVRGALPGADPQRAFAAVLGAPQLFAAVGADGDFALGGIPAGERELLLVGSDEAAARLAVTVEAARSLELGAIALPRAGRFDLQVRAPEHQTLAAGEATVVGTPWQRLSLGDELDIRGVPQGCWLIEVVVPGLGGGVQEACLAGGETRVVTFDLARPDGTEGREGCRVSGCEFGYSCESDGACR